MRRTLYIIICVAQLMVACSTDDRTPETVTPTIPEGEQPVVFSVGMADDSLSTRVGFSNDISNVAGLDSKGGFGVFGCYTGLHKYVDSNVTPDFMYNEHVVWQAASPPSAEGTWTYNPIKYWPNGEGTVTGNTGSNKHYVSFMAYAPYSDNNENNPETNPAGYCIPSFSVQGELGNPWLTYRLHSNVNHQVDLLYARHTNETPILDLTKPAINEKVHFNFDHALACVGDKVTIICSTGLQNQTNSRVVGSATNAKVEVTGFTIEYTLTSKARLVLWNHGEANWQTIWSEEPICTRTITFVDPEDNNDDVTIYAKSTTIPETFTLQGTWENKGVFYIPKELTGYAQTAKVHITYRIATYSGGNWIYDSNNIGTATLNLHDYADAYKPGKHLYINVTLNQMDIALTAAIAPWQTLEGFPKDVEGIED